MKLCVLILICLLVSCGSEPTSKSPDESLTTSVGGSGGSDLQSTGDSGEATLGESGGSTSSSEGSNTSGGTVTEDDLRQQKAVEILDDQEKLEEVADSLTVSDEEIKVLATYWLFLAFAEEDPEMGKALLGLRLLDTVQEFQEENPAFVVPTAPYIIPASRFGELPVTYTCDDNCLRVGGTLSLALDQTIDVLASKLVKWVPFAKTFEKFHLNWEQLKTGYQALNLSLKGGFATFNIYALTNQITLEDSIAVLDAVASVVAATATATAVGIVAAKIAAAATVASTILAADKVFNAVWDCSTYQAENCINCGDGFPQSKEKCDGDCPSILECSSDDVCVLVNYTGSPETCDAECLKVPIEACLPGDGCCPEGCESSIDSDCLPDCPTSIDCEVGSRSCAGQTPVTCQEVSGCSGVLEYSSDSPCSDTGLECRTWPDGVASCKEPPQFTGAWRLTFTAVDVYQEETLDFGDGTSDYVPITGYYDSERGWSEPAAPAGYDRLRLQGGIGLHHTTFTTVTFTFTEGPSETRMTTKYLDQDIELIKD